MNGTATTAELNHRSWFSWVGRADWFFVALPCASLLVVLMGCCLADVDIAISRLFYDAELDSWPVGQQQPWQAFYEYGCRPSVWIGVAGLVAGLLSYLVAAARPLREGGFFLVMTLALGPGILVNGVLKPSVARPRPCQTAAFGGQHQFAFYGGVAEANKSFPSGHASMGFFLMTPALIFYRRRPRLAAMIFLSGLTYGCLVGFARVAQGGHFVTDVIASALIVYCSGISVQMLIRQVRESPVGSTVEDSDASADTILPLPSSASIPEAELPNKRAA